MTERPNAAWATLLTRDSYLDGARVLGRSLREAGTRYPLVVMVTEGVSEQARTQLAGDGWIVRDVERVDPPSSDNSYVFGHFSEVWTKLRAWCLDYERVVLLDADMLVVGDMDALMLMPLTDGGIAACHTCRCNPEHNESYPEDWTPAHCWFTYWDGTRDLPADFEPYFNSGLVVLRPDRSVFDALVQRVSVIDVEQYPFPDQDLLNEHFRHRWVPLPMGYNALKTFAVQHPDVWSGQPGDPRVDNIHYLLAKPWDALDDEPIEPVYAELNRFWHQIAARLDT